MKKNVIISYFIKEWTRNYPQESRERKNIYCKVDYIENCINKRYTKQDLLSAIESYQNGVNIEVLMRCLLDMKQFRKVLYRW